VAVDRAHVHAAHGQAEHIERRAQGRLIEGAVVQGWKLALGALAGLGLILQDIGDDKHALQAYQAALAIDPHLRNLSDIVKTLREKVEGRDI